MKERSTKLLRLELAKVGTYKAGETSVRLTDAMLKEMADTFPGTVPVGLGHSGAQSDNLPAVGSVISAFYDTHSGALIGDVAFSDAMAQAWDAQAYTSWSIGANKNVDNKWELHHLAVLGATPPAIKNLAVLQRLDLSEKNTHIFNFSDKQEGTMPETTQALKQKTRGADLSPEHDGSAATQTQAETPPDGGRPPTNTDASTGAESVALSNAISKDPNVQAVMAHLQEQGRQSVRASFEGKLPPEGIEKMISLADAVSITQSIQLSDTQGQQRTLSSYALLSEVGMALAHPVHAGELTFSDNVSGGEDAKTRAAEEAAMYKKL